MRIFLQKSIILLLLYFSAISQIFSQESVGGVKLLARPAKSDSIMLRWAPTDKEIWKLGNKYGYIVERYTFLRNGQLTENSERFLLSAEPIKPQPLDIWQQYEETDKYISIAAECIFSESSVPLISPSMIVQRYKEEQNKFSFALFAADQSPIVAQLSGLWLVDKNVKTNEKYLYTVSIPAPDSIRIDTAFAFTGLSEYLPLPKPLYLSAQWNDKKVMLSWNILYLKHVYNSYIVEKSADGKIYKPISESPSVQAADEGIEPELAYRTDSFPDNNTVWYYRIRGITAFGETGPPSDSIFGSGRLPITNAPIITEKQVIDNKQVKLSWNFPEEMDNYVKGFNVYRSFKPEGTKQKIYAGKKPTEREFIDKSPELTNYYVISVYDNETEKFSMGLTYAELIDSIPPVPPIGLAGKIDSLGIVRLSWKENTDKDINGYRVFRSNRPDHEFMQITPAALQETNFVDTININTLTKNIYYRVKAIDLRDNQSSFGEILELKRPDIIPPVTPVIKEISAEKNGILITWYNSSSEDVIRHYIYRTAKFNDEKQQIAEILTSANFEKISTYLDKNIEGGETYIYQIVAEDDSNLRSALSSPIQAKAQGEEQSRQLKLKAKSDGETITLTWTIDTKRKIERILIYKAMGEEPLRIFTNTTANTFTDTESAFGKTLTYRIKAVYEDETTSDFSNEVKVSL